VIRAPVRVRIGYYFATFWLALVSIVPFIILSANVAGWLFAIWPVAAVAILFFGIRQTMALGIAVEESRRTLTVHNWLRSATIPFGEIKEMSQARVIIMGSRYGGPVYMPMIVARDGSRTRIGAAKGEPGDGPIHVALAQLGESLGIPVHWQPSA
jgi:hypothetical protein